MNPPAQLRTLSKSGSALPRKLGGLLSLLTFSLGLLTSPPGASQGRAEGKKAGPVPRLVRVSPPEAKGAVEVSVAINPTNPDHLVAVSVARMKDHPGVTDFAYVSNDAGRSWKTVPRANPHKTQQGDDVVTFTPDGLAVHAFISFAGIRQARPRRAHTGIVTSTSRDGVTWNAQVPVVELFNSAEPHEDKPWIRADVSDDSPHKGNLYVAWTKFDVYGSSKPEHKSHVYFSRSRDSGKSFAVPRKISDQPGDALDKSGTVMGACPGVGPKGEVYVVWAGPGSVFFARSTDGGVNFDKNKVISDCAGWDFPIKGLGRASGTPSVGVDITKGKDRGSIYVCWADARNGDPDVFLTVSRDGGETWSKPLRVNNDAKGKEQWFPWLVVDPVDGSVNIAYYDRGAREGTLTDVTLTRSVDGGRTFAHFKLNDEPYELSKLGFFGDYLGLDCRGGRVAALWMHPMDKSRRLGISSVVLDFDPGTQEARAEKREAKKSEKSDEVKVTPVPEEVVKRYKLDTEFYKKHLDYKGFSILSSAKVSDAALLEARYLIDQMLCEREDILKAMIQAGCRFMVMAPTEMTTDVPEQRHWDKKYWDKRARGMGGKLSSCGEENLLNLKGDRYNRENILIHEFNHAVHNHGLRTVDPTFDKRLRETYKNAMAKELWKGTYSATNAGEYWAEGVQAYFDCMRPQYGANTREKLQKYDPDLFALVDEVYRQSKFRYVRYDKRHPPPAKKDEAGSEKDKK
jgi:alpha-glucosidase